MLGAIATAAAPSLVSGVLGIFGAKKRRKQARSDQKKQFERLREAAERGGFNPLTALQSTGGAGFGALPSSAPPLASIDFIRDALSGVADEVTGEAAERRATDRFNRELAELQLERAKGGRAADAIVAAPGAARVGRQTTYTVAPEATSTGTLPGYAPGAVRPVARPTFTSAGSIPVFGIGGAPETMNRRVADRLGIKPWDYRMVEDVEAVYGDEAGQVIAMPQIPGAVVVNEGSKDPNKVQEYIGDPYNPKFLVPGAMKYPSLTTTPKPSTGSASRKRNR